MTGSTLSEGDQILQFVFHFIMHKLSDKKELVADVNHTNVRQKAEKILSTVNSEVTSCNHVLLPSPSCLEPEI